MVRQLDRQQPPTRTIRRYMLAMQRAVHVSFPRYGPFTQFGATWASVAVARVTRLRAATGAGNRGKARGRQLAARCCRGRCRTPAHWALRSTLAPGTVWHVRRVRMRHPSPSSLVPSHLLSPVSVSVSGGVLTRHRTCCGKPVLRPDRRVGRAWRQSDAHNTSRHTASAVKIIALPTARGQLRIAQGRSKHPTLTSIHTRVRRWIE